MTKLARWQLRHLCRRLMKFNLTRTVRLSSSFLECSIQSHPVDPLEESHESKIGYGKIKFDRFKGSDIPNCPETCAGARVNPLGVQMIPEGLRRKLFPEAAGLEEISGSKIEDLREALRRNLGVKDVLEGNCPSTTSSEYDSLVKNFVNLEGSNLNEHFLTIADRQVAPYRQIVQNALPYPPPAQFIDTRWVLQPGWTRYAPGCPPSPVPFPDEEFLVFDVEVAVKEGQGPVMAVAAAPHAWYSWCSRKLCDASVSELVASETTAISLDDLIPMEVGLARRWEDIQLSPRVVVGHNVAYDRLRIRDQYFMQGSKLRFLDTMSMHIGMSGLAADQRILYKTELKNIELNIGSKDGTNRDWMEGASGNSLLDVHKLCCPDSLLKLDKSARNHFMTDSIGEIKDKFQNLMTYCAIDVAATYEAFVALWPEFQQRMGHPVTLSGMLELSTTYLPTTDNWLKYIQRANDEFELRNESEMCKLLIDMAQKAVWLTKNSRYCTDPWLWSADWELRTVWTKHESAVFGLPSKPEDTKGFAESLWNPDGRLMVETEDELPGTSNTMFGYPAWYRELCSKKLASNKNQSSEPIGSTSSQSEPIIGSIDSKLPLPDKITSQTRITPKLLRLTWYNYPLHHDLNHGWGFLIPDPDYPKKWKQDPVEQKKFPQIFPGVFEVKIAKRVGSKEVEKIDRRKKKKIPLVDNAEGEYRLAVFPFQQILDLVHKSVKSGEIMSTSTDDTYMVKQFFDYGIGLDRDALTKAGENVGERRMDQQKKPSSQDQALLKNVEGYCEGVSLPGCIFFKLPHANGYKHNVGNPLSRSFISHLEAGRLQSSDPQVANKIIQVHNLTSFWRSYRDRISEQIPIWLENQYLPKSVIDSWDGRNHSRTTQQRIGAILPQLTPAGTITRRAIERTWMTAINPQVDKIGSEQKAMIQAPPGYRFVGADVDAQEFWIATILGDRISGVFGGAPASWQLLRGSKSDGTDQHSMVAKHLGISRSQAKVLNYGRLYGAGLPFFIQLLKQYNRNLTDKEAKDKAMKLFAMTKGKRNKFMFFQRGSEMSQRDHVIIPNSEINHLVDPSENTTDLGFKCWSGGTESDMFNGIEQIARAERPATPILGARITKSLDHVSLRGSSQFLTTKCNWVVQSSAVDYLHIMLCCMRWLIEEYDIKARFVISIHDEVRYLVEEHDAGRAALALQITNLLTRAYFAHRLGFHDLPESVAFFSSIDVDEVLRKEVDLDCATPSNPGGLSANYGIGEGVALDIRDILKKTGGRLETSRM